MSPTHPCMNKTRTCAHMQRQNTFHSFFFVTFLPGEYHWHSLTCTYNHTWSHTCTHMHTYTYPCMCVHVHVLTCVCMCVYMYVHVCQWMRMCESHTRNHTHSHMDNQLAQHSTHTHKHRKWFSSSYPPLSLFLQNTVEEVYIFRWWRVHCCRVTSAACTVHMGQGNWLPR